MQGSGGLDKEILGLGRCFTEKVRTVQFSSLSSRVRARSQAGNGNMRWFGARRWRLLWSVWRRIFLAAFMNISRRIGRFMSALLLCMWDQYVPFSSHVEAISSTPRSLSTVTSVRGYLSGTLRYGYNPNPLYFPLTWRLCLFSSSQPRPSPPRHYYSFFLSVSATPRPLAFSSSSKAGLSKNQAKKTKTRFHDELQYGREI